MSFRVATYLMAILMVFIAVLGSVHARDCTNVVCSAVVPSCPPRQSFQPVGDECCPSSCQPTNDQNACNEPCVQSCEAGFHLVKNLGDCCPRCERCPSSPCPAISCPSGTLYTPPGQCCPTECISDCGSTQCTVLRCPSGFTNMQTGTCCAQKCVPQCDNVQCSAVPTTCPQGTELRLAEGDNCCPRCLRPPQCFAACGPKVCPIGFEAVSHANTCCEYECLKVNNCRNVACATTNPICGPGFHVGTPQGQCCPGCVPDDNVCATVLCAPLNCPSGQVAKKRNPQDCCSNVCVNQCDGVNCSPLRCPDGFHVDYSNSCCGQCTHNSGSALSLSLAGLIVVFLLCAGLF